MVLGCPQPMNLCSAVAHSGLRANFDHVERRSVVNEPTGFMGCSTVFMGLKGATIPSLLGCMYIP